MPHLNEANSQDHVYGRGEAIRQLADPVAQRPLERISAEADRLSRISFMVQGFIDRFHGNPPVPAGADGAVPIQIGYRTEIDRLSANVDLLDNQVQALGELD